MLMNNFKNSKYDISKFGLGTVQFGLDYGFTKRKTQDEVNSILKTAVDNDITLIDTAREYGDSEEKIGNFIENYTYRPRKEISQNNTMVHMWCGSKEPCVHRKRNFNTLCTVERHKL